jgi:NAD(P)H-hydrate repair Nnr-like enzyme with NAD(P)H-hydrate epimerase domain
VYTANEIDEKLIEEAISLVVRTALLDPYPEDIFTPLTDEEIKTLVDAMIGTGIPNPSDRLHAQWSRHMYTVAEHVNRTQL